MTGTIAITMAGRGSRFAQQGYTSPKYEIMAHGRPLFDWSLLSLMQFRDAGYTFLYFARAGVQAEDFIQKRVTKLGLTPSPKDILTTDTVTDGQATSALMLARMADPNAPFAVYNIDTFVDPDVLAPPSDHDIAGWIPCFPAPGDGWSFARTDDTGNVIELREKKRISNHATVGLYWFDTAARYIAAYDRYFAVAGNEEKGERYIAPLYNQIIAEGAQVRICDLALKDVGMMGTPEQVNAFLVNPPPAAQRFAVVGH